MMDKYERAALNLAKRLGYRGETLPKGERWQPTRCALGKAVGGSVQRIGGLVVVNGQAQPKSKTARQFTRRFDRGRYPHLIVKGG